MKQSGKASLLTIAGIVAAAIVITLFLVRIDSPGVVASRFMTALAKGDAAKLTELSFTDGDRAKLRKDWDYSISVSRNYVFAWMIKGDQIADDNHASVRLEVVRDADRPESYPENFALPMVKVGGKWLVDVRNMSRQMFPALPR